MDSMGDYFIKMFPTTRERISDRFYEKVTKPMKNITRIVRRKADSAKDYITPKKLLLIREKREGIKKHVEDLEYLMRLAVTRVGSEDNYLRRQLELFSDDLRSLKFRGMPWNENPLNTREQGILGQAHQIYKRYMDQYSGKE